MSLPSEESSGTGLTFEHSGTLIDVAARMLLLVAIAVFFARAISLASTASYWMDEVLAVWTASQPSIADVWSALKRGSEFTPPLFDVILHGLRKLGFVTPLAMRMPSIIGIALAATGVFVLVRRHSALCIAAVACAAVLGGAAFGYAVQARPYACSTAAVTWAVVLWEEYPRARSRRRALALCIGILSALAIAFHFYAVILVAMLGVAELSRAGWGRSPRRLGLFAMIALGAASIILWWPIADAAARFNATDIAASGFYARPTALRLVISLYKLSSPLAPAMLIAAVTYLMLGVTQRRPAGEASEPDRTILQIGTVASLVPLIVFVFALLVTHAFSDRYAITAALGFALLLSCLLEKLGDRAGIVSLGILALLIVLPPPGGPAADPKRAEALATARSAPPGLPIVTGDGLRFLEIAGNETASVSDRFVFLRTADQLGDGDPTNRHQVERWAALLPTLKVREATAFLCETSRFLLFSDSAGGHDELPGKLAGAAKIHPLTQDFAQLAVVEAQPCANKSRVKMR